MELIGDPELHKIVLVPKYYLPKEHNFSFEAALPLKLNASDVEIEHFMQHSDYTVNIMASHAAIYSIGKPMRFNWETKKIDYPEKGKTHGKKQSN